MNKLSKLIAVSVVGLSSSAMIVTVAASTNANNIPIISGVQAEAERTINFATANITRRIWIVNADDWGWNTEYYIHVWLTSDNKKTSDGKITNWVNFSGETMYYHGIAYFDVTMAGAGSSLGVIVKNKSGWSGDGFVQTVDNTLPALSSSDADVIFLNAGRQYGETGNRNSEVKAAGMTTGQLAKVLNTISTCEEGYHNGFNAYPQLNKDFFVPSQTQIDQYADKTSISDLDKEGHDGYNVKNKIDKLEELYNSLGYIAE